MTAGNDTFRTVGVIAHVRLDGSLGHFERRTFEVTLDQRLSQDDQLAEAIKTIRKAGYEMNYVQWEPVPGN